MSRGESIARTTITTRTEAERAYLVAATSKNARDRWSAKASLEELAQLARAAGAEVAGKTIQQLPAPSKTHYIGKGKLAELHALKQNDGFNVLISDDELSPQQQHNLEEALDAKVIDRVALILDIFAKRARTREGQLQVELAQYQYLLPRLAGRWTHLERLGGGIGTRGPGESQLESDRRLIRRRIERLKEQIEEISKHRALYRQKRQKSHIPVVALVGYTNAGKSALLNALTHADVIVKDEPFSTLDPTTRRLVLPGRRVALLTDTVGFIRKLPPAIVTAFRATLEELAEAAVLIHVVDSAAADASAQCQTVEDILKELELQDKPRITALNKIDLLLDTGQEWDEALALSELFDQSREENTLLLSATKKWGLGQLMERLGKMLPETVLTSLPTHDDAL